MESHITNFQEFGRAACHIWQRVSARPRTLLYLALALCLASSSRLFTTRWYFFEGPLECTSLRNCLITHSILVMSVQGLPTPCYSAYVPSSGSKVVLLETAWIHKTATSKLSESHMRRGQHKQVTFLTQPSHLNRAVLHVFLVRAHPDLCHFCKVSTLLARSDAFGQSAIEQFVHICPWLSS